MGKVYEHSGRLGLAPLVLPVVGGVSALLMSLVYAYVTVYSPIAGVISLVFVAVFAVALLGSMVLGGRWAKCRNGGLLTLAGAGTGALAVYCSWAAFVAVLLAKSVPDGQETPGYLDCLLNPGGVWAACLAINQEGWYSIKSVTPTGGVLWALWGVEALIVFGGAFLGGLGAITGEVFCETCDRWCGREDGPTLALPGDDALMERVAEGDLEALASLPPAAAGRGAYLLVEVLQCEGCREAATYQVKVRQHGVDDQGKATVETSDVSPQVLTDAAGVERLAYLAERPLEEPEPGEQA